jgi:hypothetical protein
MHSHCCCCCRCCCKQLLQKGCFNMSDYKPPLEEPGLQMTTMHAPGLCTKLRFNSRYQRLSAPHTLCHGMHGLCNAGYASCLQQKPRRQHSGLFCRSCTQQHAPAFCTIRQPLHSTRATIAMQQQCSSQSPTITYTYSPAKTSLVTL